MKEGSRAVLFRAGGLGDLLVALPAVSLVRRGLPGFRLTLAARPEYGALFKTAGIVDEVAAFDDPKMTPIFAQDQPRAGGRDEDAGGRLSRVDFLSGLDLAAGWLNQRGGWPDENEWARRGMDRAFFAPYDPASGIPMSRYFFDRTLDYIRSSAAVPLIARSAGFGEAAALPIASTGDQSGTFDNCARLKLGPDFVKKALDSLGLRPLGATGRRLVVHPGSGGRAKRWPLRNFIEVVRRAAGLGVEGVLVTGEAEADIDTEIRGMALPNGWSRASRLAAETLAGLLTASTHYIGNDSGPTHLAAACGASVIAVFVDGNLPAWRPFGRTRVLSAPAVDRVPLEAVLAELDGFLGA